MNEIDPERYYNFAEAATHIPSAIRGTITTHTLRNWALRGLVAYRIRRVASRNYWFVQGSEILKLLAPDRRFSGPTPAELERQHQAAMKRLRAMGMNV